MATRCPTALCFPPCQDHRAPRPHAVPVDESSPSFGRELLHVRVTPNTPGSSAFTLIELSGWWCPIVALAAVRPASAGAGRGRGTRGGRRGCLSNLRQRWRLALNTYQVGPRRAIPAGVPLRRGRQLQLGDRHGRRGCHRPGALCAGPGHDPHPAVPRLRRPGQTGRPSPYTGYNYNTSYLGRGQLETIPEPATADRVQSPSTCARFRRRRLRRRGQQVHALAPDQPRRRRDRIGDPRRRHPGLPPPRRDPDRTRRRPRRRRHHAPTPPPTPPSPPGTGFVSPDNAAYDYD